MQRNPYWPLNGPSFFSVPRFRRCIFSRCAKVAVGFGSNFTARMASRRPNFPNKHGGSLTFNLIDSLVQSVSALRSGTRNLVEASLILAPIGRRNVLLS
jgi:hypothetical protein